MLCFLRKIGEKNGIKIFFIKKIGGFYFYFFSNMFYKYFYIFLNWIKYLFCYDNFKLGIYYIEFENEKRNFFKKIVKYVLMEILVYFCLLFFYLDFCKMYFFWNEFWLIE